MSENVSAEIESAVTEENASIFHGEINKPSGTEFPQTKGKSFKKTVFIYITSYTVTKKKMLRFATYICKPLKVRY